jgi:hypothetical protein
VSLPVDPDRLRRQFPSLTDEDLAAFADVTRRVLADPRARGRVLAETLTLAQRAREKQAQEIPLEAEERLALAYASAIGKMQGRTGSAVS